MKKENNIVGFRVNPNFKEKLLKQAEKENRSVSNLIVTVMNNYLVKTG